MNFEFLIVFTGNGLVFATLLYLIMTCEIPDPRGSEKSRIWGKIDNLMTQRQDSRSRCLPSMVAPSPGTLILLDGQERQMSSPGDSVNRP